jgi:pyruvate dehydrogenase phosphatase
MSDYAHHHLIPNISKLLKMASKGELDKLNIYKSIEGGFLMTDRQWVAEISSAFKVGFSQVARAGSCAITVFIRDNGIWTANAGDCRAVLGSKKGDIYVAEPLSNDHNCKLASEKLKLMKDHPNEENIVRCKREDSCYVKGHLQPTRSFGDVYLKFAEFNGPSPTEKFRGRHVPAPYTPPYITATPEISYREITAEDKFVIIGSDGLWDQLSNEEAVQFVSSMDSKDPQRNSADLIKFALDRGARDANMTIGQLLDLPYGQKRKRHDDITVIIVYLK